MWSWARFYFYVYVRPFIYCLYFICGRKFYARTHVKITQQWKSSLTHDNELQWRATQAWTLLKSATAREGVDKHGTAQHSGTFRSIPEHEKIKIIFMKKKWIKNDNNEIIFVKTKKQTKKEKETGIISPSDDFLGLFQTPDMTLNVLRD